MQVSAGADLRREKASQLFRYIGAHAMARDRHAAAGHGARPRLALRLSLPQLRHLLEPDGSLVFAKVPQVPCPPVTPGLRGWVDEATLQQPDAQQPTLRESATLLSAIVGDDGQVSHEVRFLQDYPGVLPEWERYLTEQWLPWAQAAADGRAELESYLRASAMLLRLRADPTAWEIVFSAGVLSVGPHEELLPLAQVALDCTEGEVRASLSTGALEPPHSWTLAAGGIDTAYEALRALLASPDEPGAPTPAPARVGDSNCTFRLDPCIVARARPRVGLWRLAAAAADAMLDETAPLPAAILDALVGVSDRRAAHLTLDATGLWGQGSEQDAVLRAVGSERVVIVDTPDGGVNGSHVAALVCGLMAHGRRVLVTAPAVGPLERCLAAIPPSLHQFCVAFMPDGVTRPEDVRDKLAGALASREEAMSGKLRAWGETGGRTAAALNASAQAADRARSELAGLLRELGSMWHLGAPAQVEAARLVLEEAESLGWLPFVPRPGEATPLLGREAMELADLIIDTEFVADREAAEASLSPHLGPLPDAESFARMARQLTETRATLAAAQEGTRARARWLISEPAHRDRDTLFEHLQAIAHLYRRLAASPAPWVRDAASDMLEGKRARWVELWSATRRYVLELSAQPDRALHARVAGANDVLLPQLLADAEALLNHMNRGGGAGFSLFRNRAAREAAYIADHVTIDGSACNTVPKVDDLCRWAECRIALSRLSGYWSLHALMEVETAGEQLAEYKGRLAALDDLMRLDEARALAADDLARSSAPIGAATTIADWVDVARLATAMLTARDSERRVAQVVADAEQFTAVREAAEALDAQAYGEALASARRAGAYAAMLARRDQLLARLGRERAAQLLEYHRSSKQHPEELRLRYRSFSKAWQWAQTNAEVLGAAGNAEFGSLASRIRGAVESLSDALEGLVSGLAWRAAASAPSKQPHGPAELLRLPGALLLPFGELPVLASMLPGSAEGWRGAAAFDAVVVHDAHDLGPEGLLLAPMASSQAIFGRANPAWARSGNPVPDKGPGAVPQEAVAGLAGLAVAAPLRVGASYLDTMGTLWGVKHQLRQTSAALGAATGPVVIASEIRDVARAISDGHVRWRAEHRTVSVVSVAGADWTDAMQRRLIEAIGCHALAALRLRFVTPDALDPRPGEVTIVHGLACEAVGLSGEGAKQAPAGQLLNSTSAGANDSLRMALAEWLAERDYELVRGPSGWDQVRGENRHIDLLIVGEGDPPTVEVLRELVQADSGFCFISPLEYAWNGESAFDAVLSCLKASAVRPLSRGDQAATPELPILVEGDELTSLFRERGFEVTDRRAGGGCLWVIGGRSLSPAMEALEKGGVYFQFAPGGSKATQYRAAWFTR